MKINSFSLDNQKRMNNLMMLTNGFLSCYGVIEEETDQSIPVLKYHDVNQETILYNPLFSFIKANDLLLNPKFIMPVNHEQNYDISNDILTRKSIYSVNNTLITIESERFIDKDNLMIYSTYKFYTSDEITLDFYHGINENIEKSKLNTTLVESSLHEILVNTDHPDFQMALLYEKDFRHKNIHGFNDAIEHYNIKTEANRIYTITKYIGIGSDINILRKSLRSKVNIGYEALKKSHSELKEKELNLYRVQVSNNDAFQKLVDFSLRHLLNDNSHYNIEDSLGLNTWFNHYFTIFNMPEKTRSYFKNQINRLSGARTNAEELGCRGAFYIDDSNRIDLREYSLLEGAILVSIMNVYLEYTEDYSIFIEGGLQVIYEICLFYYQYANYDEKLHHYSLMNVSNIDYTINHIDNHTLTNHMVKHSFRIFKALMRDIKKKSLTYYKEFVKKNSYHKIEDDFNLFYQKLYIMRTNHDDLLFSYESFNKDFQQSRISNFDKKINISLDHLLVLILFKNRFTQSTLEKNYRFILENAEMTQMNQLLTSLLPIEGNIDLAYEWLMEYASLNKSSLFANENNLDIGIAGVIYYLILYRFSKLDRFHHQFVVDALIPKAIRRLEYKFKYLNFTANMKIKRNSARIEWNE